MSFASHDSSSAVRVASPRSRDDSNGDLELLAADDVSAFEPENDESSHADTARLAAMFEANVDFIFRSIRKMGLDAAAAEDVTQQVFLVARRRLSVIDPDRERAFLFSTAVFEVSNARRTLRRRREDLVEHDRIDGAPSAEERVHRAQLRKLIDEILEAMEPDQRAVFVLFELEEMTTAEIASLLGVPEGTVSSRLRRARAVFHEKASLRMRTGSLR